MRVRVVRTPGELRDVIGHKVMVLKDWEGGVVNELTPDEISAAGFHPKAHELVYLVKFDRWEQEIPVPAINLVAIDEPAEQWA